jgi:hypothetical protein
MAAEAMAAEAIARNSEKAQSKWVPRSGDQPVLQSQGYTFDSKDPRCLDGLGMAFSARGTLSGS